GPPDPIQTCRRVQRHDLLCWLAERARRDHWYSEGNNKPYFLDSGESYIAAAETEVKGALPPDPDKQSDPRLTQTAELSARLRKNSKFQLKLQGEDHPSKTGTATLDLTDETCFSRVYQLTAPESLEEGRPVYAMKASEGLVAARTGSKEAREWTEVILAG